MSRIIFQCVPYDKNAVTLALESGVDVIAVPREHCDAVRKLARCEVLPCEEIVTMKIAGKEDELAVAEALKRGEKVVVAPGWEVIPLENLLAQSGNVWVEAETAERAKVASGILERGVDAIVVTAANVGNLKETVSVAKIHQGRETLEEATITRVETAGLGHRVCVDTMSLLKRGQGMLVGNSSAFTFLVHAETEHNEYVAARPFRVNAGAVHAYVRLPHDRTTYLGELKAGEECLIVDANGETTLATIGRVKIEVRPMLLIEAEVTGPDGEIRKGAIFLQNAETIRLTAPGGAPVSVVGLKPGDRVLCRLDQAGRHFGMRVTEEIREV